MMLFIKRKFHGAFSLLNRNFRDLFLDDLVWFFHSDRKKIPADLVAQYKVIFRRTSKFLGVYPKIFSGDDLNNKLKWLMLFDQDPVIIDLCDKIKVRNFVEKNVGPSYLNKIYGIWNNAKDIEFNSLPNEFVIKTNHDSGSVWLVHKNNLCELDLRKKVNKSLGLVYGVEKGEWFYQYVKPAVFAEEFVNGMYGEIEDYKFHCSKGEVVFVHYIYDRASGKPKEEILSAAGSELNIRLDQNFVTGSEFRRRGVPKQWNEMIEVAKKLSVNFKYVRIDLYITTKGVRFGEMTFHPMNGNYGGPGQKHLGQLLSIDRESRKNAFKIEEKSQ